MATVKTLLIDKNSDNFDAKNKFNTLILEGISYDDIKSMKINDEDDLLIIETEDREIVIDNYKKVRYITTDEITLGIPHPKTTDIIKEALVDNTDNEITDDDRKNLKLSGTNYNDKINAINYDVPQDKKNKDKGLTINAGDGNDEITGTLGNDTITGGEGTNTIVVKGDFGKDTVVLTKGETLILDLSDYEFDSIEDIDFDASDKKNFIINIKDNMNIGGTLILKNYTKQNFLGTKVLINIGDEDNMIDLNTLDIFEYGKDDFSKGVFKGTRFSETIDASGFTSALGKKNKGVTIDGGAGYNIIYGTDGFNDTIKGGNDGNDITAGDGNKTITTGSGDDKITITGDGTHTIKAGTGENDIEIKGDGKTTITTGKDKDTINVENYEGTTTITAGDGENDITVMGDATTVIKSGKDDDTINISNDSTASSTIYAGKGNNTININNSDTFGNVILTEEKVNATNTIAFLYEFDKDYYLVKNGNDLIIKHGNAPDYMGEEDDLEHFTGEESSLTLKEFFKYNSKYATYKFKVNGEDKTYDELKDLTNGLWIVGKSTIRGTNEADNIHALGKSANAIYAGKGDDEIYGNGKSSIYFFEGDGHDTVMYSGNTLIFEKNTDIRFERDLNPESFTKEGFFSYTDCAKLYYGDKGDYVYLYNVDAATDKETYIQIGNKKRLLSTLVKSKGIDGINLREKEDNKTITGSNRGVDIINVEGDNCTVNALNGNNRIETRTGNNTTVYGGDDIDVIFTSNDIIYAGKGDDIIYGDNSDLHFKNGDGHDIVKMDNPRLYFDDATDINDIDRYIEDDYIVLEYNKKQDSVRLNYADNKPYQIIIGDYIYNMKSLSVDNLVVGSYTYEDYAPNRIYGTLGNDEINVPNSVYAVYCNEGNDDVTVSGSVRDIHCDHGNNIITIGSSGSVTGSIISGTGSDTFRFYSGSGSITIKNSSVNDCIEFPDVKYEDLSFEYNSNDELIITNPDNEKITIKDFISSKIDNIKALDEDGALKEYTIHSSNIDGLLIGTSGKDVLTTTKDTKYVVVKGLEEDDKITVSNSHSATEVFGNEGDDEIIISGTVDSVYGDGMYNIQMHNMGIYGKHKIRDYEYKGNDKITVSGKADAIYAGDGNDIIDISGTVNQVNCDYGDDTVIVSGEVDNIDCGFGNDNVTVSGIVNGDINGCFGDGTVIIEKDAVVDGCITFFRENSNITVYGYVNEIKPWGYYNYTSNIDILGSVNTIETYCAEDTITIEEGAIVNWTISTSDSDDTIINRGSVLGYLNLSDGACGIWAGYGDDEIINNGTVVYGITGGWGNDKITNGINGTVQSIYGDHLSGDSGGNDIIINNGVVLSEIRADSGNDTITTGAGSSTGYISFNNHDGDDTLYLNATVNNLSFASNTGDKIYTWNGDDLVINYNDNQDSITIKNYDPNNTNIVVKIGTNNENYIDLATLVPEKPITQTMSLGASNTGINELNYQVATFTSTSSTDIQLNYTTPDTNDISVVMSEYINTDLQGNV